MSIVRTQKENGWNAKSPLDKMSGPFLKLIRRLPTFPHGQPCSIIGSSRLNYRVRDGNGCDPADTITGKLVKIKLDP